jgi:hypothetical protein
MSEQQEKAMRMALEALELGDDISAKQMWIALEALRQALAQTEQEPVAWLGVYRGVASELAFQDFDIVVDADWTRLPLYTAPPKREWVGLTDKDWNRSKHNYEFQKGVDWAEAILKEKNT